MFHVRVRGGVGWGDTVQRGPQSWPYRVKPYRTHNVPTRLPVHTVISPTELFYTSDAIWYHLFALIVVTWPRQRCSFEHKVGTRLYNRTPSYGFTYRLPYATSKPEFQCTHRHDWRSSCTHTQTQTSTAHDCQHSAHTHWEHAGRRALGVTSRDCGDSADTNPQHVTRTLTPRPSTLWSH